MVQRVRARHGKRLPQAAGDPGILTGPVTLTVIQTAPVGTTDNIVTPIVTPAVTPTVTVFITASTPDVTSTSSLLPVPISPPVTDNTTTSSSASASATPAVSPAPTPSVSVDINKGDKNSPSSAASSSSTPTGAIVGIVLAVVLLVAAALIFFFRRRAVAKRMKKRMWVSKPSSAPSFLFVEPKGSEMQTVAPFPGAYPTLAPNRRAPSTYGQISEPQRDFYNNGIPYMPPPAPPRPPPAAGIYDNPTASPARKASSVPQDPNFPPSPAVSQVAKVVSTFIPTLPDELSITTGEVIQIYTEYDDGWVMCSNNRGEMGMVPMECLDRGLSQRQVNREYRRSIRASSLAARAYTGYQ